MSFVQSGMLFQSLEVHWNHSELNFLVFLLSWASKPEIPAEYFLFLPEISNLPPHIS